MSRLRALAAVGSSAAQRLWYSRRQRQYDLDLSFTEAVTRFRNPNALHAYMHHFQHHLCPQPIRTHRAYFRRKRRGFGEDAFHAMWWLLLREFSPTYCLEIGVYRGQVISLWALIARLIGLPCQVHGISPFTAAGDSVSNYPQAVDYRADIQRSFARFGLPDPTLVSALSTDVEAVKHVAARSWDLIYIDGSHDYEVALADYRLCRRYLAPGGLLVLDDSSLGTDFHPPLFSFAGHPGPSRVAAEVARRELRFLGAVGHNNVFRNG